MWPLTALSSGIDPFLLWLIVWDPSMETQARRTPTDLELLSETPLGDAIERPSIDLAPAAIIMNIGIRREIDESENSNFLLLL